MVILKSPPWPVLAKRIGTTILACRGRSTRKRQWARLKFSDDSVRLIHVAFSIARRAFRPRFPPQPKGAPHDHSLAPRRPRARLAALHRHRLRPDHRARGQGGRDDEDRQEGAEGAEFLALLAVQALGVR